MSKAIKETFLTLAMFGIGFVAIDVQAAESVTPATTTTTTSTTTTSTTPPVQSTPPAQVVTPPVQSTPVTTEKALTPEETKASYDKLIASAGVTYVLTKPNLDITVDESKALAALPDLEKQGMINGTIPPADVAAMPISISGALIGVSFSAVIIHTEFQNDPSLDKLHVQVYLLPTDSKSDADKQLCYSFDFTRELFNKTNWDTVTPKDIMVNSPNFKFSDWCQSAIDKESK